MGCWLLVEEPLTTIRSLFAVTDVLHGNGDEQEAKALLDAGDYDSFSFAVRSLCVRCPAVPRGSHDLWATNNGQRLLAATFACYSPPPLSGVVGLYWPGLNQRTLYT